MGLRMNLTIAEGVCSAIMATVPKIDYEEQRRALIVADIESKMHPKVRAVYDDAKLRDALDAQYFYLDNGPGLHVRGGHGIKVSAETKAEANKLHEAAKKQSKEREKLSSALIAQLRACRTVAQAAERYPELARYLPSTSKASEQQLMDPTLVAQLKDAGAKIP